MSRHRCKLCSHAADERGAVMVSALLFFVCLGTFLSILLLQEQADFWEMRMQQTADIVSKGARAAGKGEYVDGGGKVKKRLFATAREARRRGVEIVRGAREEAEILWRNNQPFLASSGRDFAAIVHQKGEQQRLYKQGIYHVRVTLEKELPAFWDFFCVKVEKVSQSEI